MRHPVKDAPVSKQASFAGRQRWACYMNGAARGNPNRDSDRFCHCRLLPFNKSAVALNHTL
jgi:hypothetical protein